MVHLLQLAGNRIEREPLIIFDFLLVVVLGLLLYTISARDPAARPGIFDRLFLGLIRGTAPFARLERWQTNYMVVYAVWAWTVVFASRRYSATPDRGR